MNRRIIPLAVLAAAMVSGWAGADMLSPGNYMATLTPAIDANQADAIALQLQQMDALRAVEVKPTDSTVLFTVKNKQPVDLSTIQKAVSTAAPGESMSNPAAEPVSATHQSPDTDRAPGQATGD